MPVFRGSEACPAFPSVGIYAGYLLSYLLSSSIFGWVAVDTDSVWQEQGRVPKPHTQCNLGSSVRTSKSP